MQMKRRSLIGKLLKLVGRGNTVRAKSSLCALEAKREKARKQRSSLSSHLSHIEPMPTIFEEDEEAFYAVC